MNKVIAFVIGLVVALMALASVLFVVDQRQFGVVYTMGQINRVVTQPGLYAKFPPPFQNVRFLDKRLLVLDSQDNESMLTAEKQRVVVDWYVRWRIADPQAYIRNVGLDEAAGSLQLARVVRNAFQQEINKYTVTEV
ncbi:MAG: SPFH domain-containing protein, partial [Brachymonas sp.]